MAVVVAVTVVAVVTVVAAVTVVAVVALSLITSSWPVLRNCLVLLAGLAKECYIKHAPLLELDMFVTFLKYRLL